MKTKGGQKRKIRGKNAAGEVAQRTPPGVLQKELDLLNPNELTLSKRGRVSTV